MRNWRQTLLSGAHLTGIWTLAVVQPLLDLLKNGDVLTYAGWQPMDIVVFVVGAIFFVPALLLAIELLVGAIGGERARGICHLIFLVVLISAFAAYIIKELEPTALLRFAVAPLIGLLGAMAYERSENARTFVSVLAFAPVVVIVNFFFLSPVSSLVFPSSVTGQISAPNRNAPVVVVVFDEFPVASLMNRHGNLDRARYPAFSSLARSATWFPYATTVQDFTDSAMPALETGTYASDGGPPSSDAYPDNLFTLLGPSHSLHVFEEFRMCPESLCPDQSPESPLTRIGDLIPALSKAALNNFAPNALIARLPAPGLVAPLDPPDELGRAFTRTLSETDRPGLYFLHISLPHSPWLYVPSGKKVKLTACCTEDFLPNIGFNPRLGLPFFGGDTWTGDRELVKRLHQRHLAQVGFADHFLGRLIARLRNVGLFDQSMLIVTADHGISFKPNLPERRLIEGNGAAIRGVPLFIKRPFQSHSLISPTHAQTIDLLPTIARTLGIRVSWQFDGKPISSLEEDDRRQLTTFNTLGQRRRTIPASVHDRELADLVRESDRQFGSREDGLQLFAVGPGQQLLGRKTTGETNKQPVGTFTLDEESAYRSVDRQSDVLPTLVTGALPEEQPSSRPIALAVNGRIAAVTRPYDSVDGFRFMALIPETSLREGRNRIGLWVVRRSGRLAPLRQTQARFG